MNIYLISGVGEGKTKLSAFDTTLYHMGIYNYNLLILSSVIPTHATVVEVPKYQPPANQWGHKLYVVKSDIRSDIKGQFIGAALGWYQAEDDKRGIFVEFEDSGKSAAAVEQKITRNITNCILDMCLTRGFPADPTKIMKRISITQVKGKPACALVVAAYEAEGWKD